MICLPNKNKTLIFQFPNIRNQGLIAARYIGDWQLGSKYISVTGRLENKTRTSKSGSYTLQLAILNERLEEFNQAQEVSPEYIWLIVVVIPVSISYPSL